MEPAAIYTFNAWLYGSFIISYVVIVVCYWKVFRAVEEHNAAVAPNLNQRNRNSQEGSRTEEVSVARAVATIVLSFTLCWIPAEVMDTMDKINPLLLPRQVGAFTFFADLNKITAVTNQLSCAGVKEFNWEPQLNKMNK